MTIESLSSLRERAQRARVTGPLGCRLLLETTASEGEVTALAIRDMSPQGMSLVVNTALHVGAPVTLVFTDQDVQMRFDSVVAWCRPADEMGGDMPATWPGRFAAGLHVLGSNSLALMLGRMPLSAAA